MALLGITVHHWDAGVAESGRLTAAQGFAALAAPLLSLALRRLAHGLTAQLVVVLPLAVLAVTPHWAVGVLSLVLLGAGLTVVECGTTRMLQQCAPARHTGTALGLSDAALVGAAMLGALAASVLGGVGLGVVLGRMHRARLVVGGPVQRVHLHRLVADVGDVVPGAGGHQDGPVVLDLFTEAQV